jgi:hypothetical protein
MKKFYKTYKAPLNKQLIGIVVGAEKGNGIGSLHDKIIVKAFQILGKLWTFRSYQK